MPIASTPACLREAYLMNYPLLPADAAAYAWQLSCCLVTLLFAMFVMLILQGLAVVLRNLHALRSGSFDAPVHRDDVL